MQFIKLLFRKVGCAFAGIFHTVRYELSFKIELLGVLGVFIFVYIMWPLEPYEIMGLIISYGLVLVTEMVNTALETSLERLHPEHHDLIGKSKDVAAGSVLLAYILFLLVVLVIIFG